MVELRKRPPPKDAPASQPAAKRGSGAGAKVKKMAEKAKETVMGGTFQLSYSQSGSFCDVLLVWLVRLQDYKSQYYDYRYVLGYLAPIHGMHC